MQLKTKQKKQDEWSPSLLVSIGNTETRRDKGKDYTAYKLSITDRETNQKYLIYKRFREFDALHKLIKKRFPNYNFNHLPPKMVMGSLNKEIVESRRIMLETYITSLLSKEDVFSSSEIKEFFELNGKRERANTNPELLSQQLNNTMRDSQEGFSSPEIQKSNIKQLGKSNSFKKPTFDSPFSSAPSSTFNSPTVDTRPNSLRNGGLNSASTSRIPTNTFSTSSVPDIASRIRKDPLSKNS